jgi:hypothetical protein
VVRPPAGVLAGAVVPGLCCLRGARLHESARDLAVGDLAGAARARVVPALPGPLREAQAKVETPSFDRAGKSHPAVGRGAPHRPRAGAAAPTPQGDRRGRGVRQRCGKRCVRHAEHRPPRPSRLAAAHGAEAGAPGATITAVTADRPREGHAAASSGHRGGGGGRRSATTALGRRRRHGHGSN